MHTNRDHQHDALFARVERVAASYGLAVFDLQFRRESIGWVLRETLKRRPALVTAWLLPRVAQRWPVFQPLQRLPDHFVGTVAEDVLGAVSGQPAPPPPPGEPASRRSWGLASLPASSPPV